MNQRLILFLMTFLTFGVLPIQSQETISKKDLGIVIRTDILFNTLIFISNESRFYKTFDLEKYLNNKNSICLTYIDYRFEGTDDNSLFFAYKYYTTNKKMNQGFYISPFIGYDYYQEKNSNPTYKLTANWAGLGFSLGYEKIFLDRLSTNFNVGYGEWMDLNRKIVQNPAGVIERFRNSKPILRMELNVGFKF
jgi:hypothetical protein